MQDPILIYGGAINSLMKKHPKAAGRILTFGFQAYGKVISIRPDPRLPRSRQMLAVMVNHALVRMLKGKERSVLTSVFLPCEMLYAFDLEPMCAELYAGFMNGSGAEHGFIEAAEEAGIAETYCSYHKVLMGAVSDQVLPRPGLVVNTSLVCDANNLTFSTVAEKYGIPHYYVDVPPEVSEESVAYVKEQLLELKSFLENHTGRKMDEEKLRQAVASSFQTLELAKKNLELKSRKYLPGDLTSEMYEIYVTLIGLGRQEPLDYMKQLHQDLQKAGPHDGIRLLWLHAVPFWQTPLQQRLNFSENVQVITCDMTYSNPEHADPSDPYDFIARRMVENAWNGRWDRRIERALQLAGTAAVDGVICFCHWGCKQTMGMSVLAKNRLEQAGYPVLILNGDGVDRRNTSDGQTATRLDAFLEMLEAKRHG